MLETRLSLDMFGIDSLDMTPICYVLPKNWVLYNISVYFYGSPFQVYLCIKVYCFLKNKTGLKNIVADKPPRNSIRS